MASRHPTTATTIIGFADEDVEQEMRTLLPSGTPLFPTPRETIVTVLTRLDEAWAEAKESPPIVRSARMNQIIESFARYTGMELAIQQLRERMGAVNQSLRERLQEAGWTPPAEEQSLPGLPAPEKQSEPADTGVKVIEVDE